jgi:23S rRNA (cytosine1962-C5)-methyltransferase
MTVWRLKSGADRRFRSGHPWVYSNELSESPKGIEPGAPVELRDAGGKFLARGYGNPSSLISFRTLTRDEAIKDPASVDELTKALTRAGSLRRLLGLADVSHRLCFAEGDFLPGLIIDRYLFAHGGQAFVLQAHTAGMDRVVSSLIQALEKYNAGSDVPWSKTAVVINNDLSVRKLEGIAVEEARIAKELAGVNLAQVDILVSAATPGQKPLVFTADLITGQKTGFFLDQAANIELAVKRLSLLRPEKGPIKILDLCCYVGQWGTQLTRAFRSQTHGPQVEVTFFDASSEALKLAKLNAEREGAKVSTIQGDVLEDLKSIEASSFDIVISDPPALIKGKKDIPQGTHAYLQLNTQALRVVRGGGVLISCSCSSLLEEEELLRVLGKAAGRNQAVVQWVGRGAQAADHPILTAFPEGRYLKGWIGKVTK